MSEVGKSAGGKEPEVVVVETPIVETPVAGVVEETPAKVETPVVETPPVVEVKPEDWRDRRIATLTARLREKEAQTPAPAVTPATSEGGTGLTQADVERLANERAGGLAAQAAFNQACNDVALQARKEYPDFDARLGELRRLVDPSDAASVAGYNRFLAVAIETGEAPRILHELGGDLNEAARVLSLPEAKMGIELTKLVMTDPKQVSSAPKPLTPLRGQNAAHATIDPTDAARSDSLSSTEWHRRRQAQEDAKFASRGGARK